MTSLSEIRETFGFFDDWEDKYRFVIDLGKSLDGIPEADKQDAALVKGCQSQVWLYADYNKTNNQIELRMDSDAFIVRGLIAIVLAALNHKTPQDILAYDVEALFEELDLLTHLSPTRGNGLVAMINQIRDHAQRYAA